MKGDGAANGVRGRSRRCGGRRGAAPVRATRQRQGLTMVEVAACTVLVALVLAAALQTAGAAKVTQTRAADLVLAQTLGQAMLAEVMHKPFLDPETVDPKNPGPAGVEVGEDSTKKTTFDDVDDFAKWIEAPPQDSSGAALLGREDWRREVTVQWVDPDDLTTVRTTATDAKKVTVNVLRGGRRLSTLTAVRTNAP